MFSTVVANHPKTHLTTLMAQQQTLEDDRVMLSIPCLQTQVRSAWTNQIYGRLLQTVGGCQPVGKTL